MRHADELSAKVEAVNLANKTANEIYPVLADIFRPLIGQNITKNDGTLLARVVKLLPEFINTHNVTVYGKTSKHGYSLSFTVKTCINYGDHTCTYHEVGVYIGNMSNGVLTGMMDVDIRKTDYTVEEVKRLREAARKAQDAYHEARSACGIFGER